MSPQEAFDLVRARLVSVRDVGDVFTTTFVKMQRKVPIDSGDVVTSLIGRAVATMAYLERNAKRTSVPEVFAEAALSWLDEAGVP